MPVLANHRKSKVAALLRLLYEELDDSPHISSLHKLLMRTVFEKFSKVLVSAPDEQIESIIQLARKVSTELLDILDDDNITAGEMRERVSSMLAPFSK